MKRQGKEVQDQRVDVCSRNADAYRGGYQSTISHPSALP